MVDIPHTHTHTNMNAQFTKILQFVHHQVICIYTLLESTCGLKTILP